MKIKVTPKELVEQTLRLSRRAGEALFEHADEYHSVLGLKLIKQLNQLETYGYDTGKEDY